MKMGNAGKFLGTAAAVAAGVFLAGTVMNAFRGNELVQYARSGFDS
jgi:hypothetical protein